MRTYRAVAEVGAPAVVVVHDWYGLLPHVRGVCDRLAAAGVTALAVDLYGGRSTTDETQAEALMAALDGGAARQQIIAAVRDARRAGVLAPRVLGLGYSMGGQLVLDLARQGLFDAAVAYYASLGPDDVPMPCPLQLHLAGEVDFEPPDLPQQFTAAVRAAGGAAQDFTYAGTRHSFANADVSYADVRAAALAEQRTLAFLRGNV